MIRKKEEVGIRGQTQRGNMKCPYDRLLKHIHFRMVHNTVSI